jgi:hypothetical protein
MSALGPFCLIFDLELAGESVEGSLLLCQLVLLAMHSLASPQLDKVDSQLKN